MQTGSATIIVDNLPARHVAASAGRISTTAGTALGIFNAPRDEEKDVKLIRKVLSSGHRTIVEHHSMSIAFDDVSVLVEQFVIEFRLAAYTVKSRRYVDYSGAGFVIPETLPLSIAAEYTERMEYLFDFYARMVAEGISKEDARFVLPYCFRSNFYCTMDVRELAHMIATMVYGRGSRFSEIKALGLSLKEQFDAIYPGFVESMEKRYAAATTSAPMPKKFLSGRALEGGARLLSATENPGQVLRDAVRFSERFPVLGETDRDLARYLTHDVRPRELEMINLNFAIDHVSLACVTHITRHRMLSLMVPDVSDAIAGGDYVLPASIEATPGIREEYIKCFADQTEFARKMVAGGMRMEDTSYLALSGHQVNLRLAMNARELLHFLKLRMCRRAQWEIRAVAEQMQAAAVEYSDIFRAFGPSCAVDGTCPEGRLTCGRPYPKA